MKIEEAIKVPLKDAIEDILSSTFDYEEKVEQLMLTVEDFAGAIATARKKGEYPPCRMPVGKLEKADETIA